MNKILKFFLWLLGGLFVVVLVGLIFFNLSFPKSNPPSNVEVKYTPERIERGKYLANHVTGCMDCHSPRDFSFYGGPVISGKAGSGGDLFDINLGVPGKLFPPNLTPFNLKKYSDGELIRAMTEGINKDGKALFPLMPYRNLAQLSKEDIYSIVAYIRTLPSVENTVDEGSLDFPMNLIVKTIPQPVTLKESFDKTNSVAYGKYLVTVASCADCHTPMDKGTPIAGKDFAGGFTVTFPKFKVTSANITPDIETGIGSWTKETFIARFKVDTDSSYVPTKLPEGAFNTIMPWLFYSGMTREDLGAIYDYLRTVKPVKNQITRFTAR
ncbi:MAG: cytochrome c [Ignavibacteriaceae bacterium]|jgi:mono/diheme cytochrome c family protein